MTLNPVRSTAYSAGLMGPRPASHRRQRPPAATSVLAGMNGALDDAFAALEKARGELGDCNRELQALEGRQRKAAAEDAADYAAARRSGAKDPGAKHVEAHARQLADAQRRQAGLRVLTAGLTEDIDRLLDLHGHELAAKVLAQRNGLLAEQREAETAAAAASEAVKRIETTLAWIQQPGRPDDDDDDDHGVAA